MKKRDRYPDRDSDRRPSPAAGRALLFAVITAVALMVPGCELDPPVVPEPTFQIRVEFEGGDAGSYAASFDTPAALTFTDTGGGVFETASDLAYADFAAADSTDDPAVIRVYAERTDTSERLAVTIIQIETSMTPPGEQELEEVIYEPDGTEGASENPSLEIDLTVAVPRS
ncbi:MAG: hypothetical protein ACLFNQ_13490 [Spirochaetaceae bacterium]